MRSTKKSRVVTLFVAASVMAALLAATPATAADDTAATEGAASQSLVLEGAEEFGPFTPTQVSMSDGVAAAGWQPGDAVIEVPRQTYDVAPPGEPANPTTWTVDSLLDVQERAGTSRALSAPVLNFAGQAFSAVSPPDTVGDIGPNHYVQMINAAGGAQVAMYNKANGAVVLAPFLLDTIGAPAPCNDGAGDPIVLFDHLADQWLISEFSGAGNFLCVYISQTNDPTGAYWVYSFATPTFPDYPKYAVWPDAYYVSTNEGGTPAVYALDRTQMLVGAAATSQRFMAMSLTGFGFQALTPADLDGPAPPGGAPGIFARHRDDEAHNAGSNNPTSDFLDLFEFTVDWVTPANSTFTGPVSVPTTEFDSDLCGLVSFFCFPQPGTANTLDPLREVIMWRLVYRNFGAHQTLVGNFVTDVNGADRGGVRWFELRKGGATPWSLHQEGTIAPDAHNRWMGAIAMDQNANIALGYNLSSSTVFPELVYDGRQASAPLGTMPEAEQTLVAGGSSWLASTRWGDYSAMSVDPVDGCTFWFTGETVDGANQWTTQIGTFKFASCAPDAVAPTVTLTTPANGASFSQGAVVFSAYQCFDGGSGVASCVGNVVNGNPIDTATPGAKTFTVTGTDHVGNVNVVVHNYTVDVTAPKVTITSPGNGATFTRGATVLSNYSCLDEAGGSGLASCVGDVANGAAIDTATAGAKTFMVTGTDNAGNVKAATHNYTVIAPDSVGVVNTANAQWYLRNTQGVVTNFEYGNPVDEPISGDWDGNPTSTPGLFRQSDGFLYARNSNSTGIANFECFAGDPSDVPLAGDWDGDGDDNLGIMRLVNNQPTFYLYTTTCNNAPMGAAQISFEFGDSGDTPVVGDWDGDGEDEIGLYRRSNGFFYNRNTLDTGVAHNACFAGDPSDYPIGGDWDGDGDGNLGIYRPLAQKFFLFTTSCVGTAPPATPFANAMGAAQIEVSLPVAGADVTKLRPVSGAFGLG